MKILLLALFLTGCESEAEFKNSEFGCTGEEIALVKTDIDMCIEVGELPSDCYLVSRLSDCYESVTSSDE